MDKTAMRSKRFKLRRPGERDDVDVHIDRGAIAIVGSDTLDLPPMSARIIARWLLTLADDLERRTEPFE